MKTTIGVGEYASTKNPEENIQTLGLGSCIALCALDPKTRSVGMVHVALPDSMINPKMSIDLPGYFANTGIPALFDEMAKLGCDRRGAGFIIKLAGGAHVLGSDTNFHIGKRNLKAIQEVLDIYGLKISAMDVGGKCSRSVIIDTASGKVVVTYADRRKKQI
jgi:chemotaxis protein CheD